MMRSDRGGGGGYVRFGDEELKLPPLNKKLILLVILAIILLVAIFTSFYQIETYEVGVVKRFGAYVRTAPPGLHWKFPLGIETMDKVITEQVFKQEFGFQTVRSGIESQFAGSKSPEESRLLTGDLNIAVVEWVIHYKKADPVKYLFNVRNVEGTIRDVSESVMRLVVGDGSIDEVITKNRQEIVMQVKEKMQTILNYYETGIRITNVELTDVNPPDPVKPSFNAVNTARQEMQKMENEAWEAYNKIIPKAKGTAEKTIQQAEAYKLNRLNRAQGDAERFKSVWNEYRLAKDVTRRRLYLETLHEVLPKINKKFIVDDEQKGWLPLIRSNEMKGGK
jgi:membrane protease subunit HflK